MGRNVRRVLLLVEDDPLVSSAVVRGLKPSFDQVVIAQDAASAIHTLATVRVDVVLSDFNLGRGPTGVDLLEMVALAWPAVRRVLYSGTHAHIQTEFAHAVLAKTATLAELLAALSP